MGGFANNAPIVTDGLVFYVDAGNSKSYDGVSGGTTWTDLVGSNDGTLTNMETNPANAGYVYDSGNGGQIDFDGTDDIAESSVNPSVFSAGHDAYTVSYWVRYDSLGGFPTVLELRFGTSNQWSDYINADKLTAYPGSQVNITNSILSIGTWYNFCVTISQGPGNVFHAYINGSLDKTGSWNRSHGTPTKYRIGGNIATRRFNGQIGTVSYYNRALSASEALQNYNALKNRFI
jgi:hypothetical protein